MLKTPQTAYICIIYEGDLSREYNPDLPAGTTVKLFLEVPDNGSYTLTPEQLNQLPAGGRVSISLARGNFEAADESNTGLETLVSAITYSNSGPIGIIQ